MATKSKIELPSMLAFERKLETSDALMFSGMWSNRQQEKIEVSRLGKDGKEFTQEIDAWKPIPITERWNRSTQSAHGTSEENMRQPNPVSAGSDDANLPKDSDTLKVSWSLRVVGNLGKPFGCNAPDFELAIMQKVDGFKGGDGIKKLAIRYAYNIANGRFLWRNRACADEIEIFVKLNSEEKSLKFNANDFNLNSFDKNIDDENLSKLADAIENGLKGDSESFVFIEVDAYAKLGSLQHVFPSQEMNMNAKGKTLFQLDGCAAMHNVKIGNALRTIDTWFSRFYEVQQPIAIEPFGAVTQRGDAYRKSQKEGNLYSLMIDWVNEGPLHVDQQAYVVANLIRGGVFSKQSDKGKKG